MQKEFFLSLLLAFLGNSMIAIGQSIQKSQVSSFSGDESGKKKLGRILFWVLGIASSNGGLVLIYKAIALGYTTVVGAMNASALMVLLLISARFLHEEIKKAELIGVLLIFLGTVLFGIFPSTQTAVYGFSLLWLWIGTGIAVLIFILALTFLAIRKKKNGLILAGFAGMLTAISQLFQKVANLPHIINRLEPVASFLQKWSFLPFLGASFLALQFAYRHEKAVTVIPVFNAVTVIVPIWVGRQFFGESLSIGQWAGVALILGGILLINYYSVSEEIAREKD